MTLEDIIDEYNKVPSEDNYRGNPYLVGTLAEFSFSRIVI